MSDQAEGVRPVVLRAAALVAGVLGWLGVVAGRPPGPFAVVVLGLVVLSAYAPGGAAPTAALLALVVLQLREGDLGPLLALTVAAVGAHHTLCALAGALPADARVRPDALRRPILQYLAVTAAALLLLGAALAVRGQVVPDALLLEATVALAAATVVVVVAVVRAQLPRRRG